MSEEVTLDEFAKGDESDAQRQRWKKVQLHQVAYKRSDNVNPQEIELEKHIGLEHIDPNNPVPDWEPLDDLSSTKRRFEAGDILFAKLRPNLEKSAQPNFEGVASTDIFPIVSEASLNSKWLLYRLSSKPAYDYARRTSAGTRMPRTSWNLFSNFDFALPPLPEQRKIASVLYNVDQAIQKTKEIIDQAGQLRQATEQDLFREGYSNHDKIEERRLVEFPADWDFEQLSEHTIESAFGPRYDSEKYDENGGIATLRTTDLDRRGNITRETMPRADLDINEFQKHLLKKGDLVVSRSGAYSGITTTWDGHEIPTIPGAYMIRFRLENTLNPEYLRYYFNSNVGRSRINRRKKGSGQQNIAGSDLLNMRIPIPSKEEQEKIVEVVNSIESQILFNKDYCERLECLKRGLMQDLLSGTVRTTDTNIEIPEEVAQYG